MNAHEIAKARTKKAVVGREAICMRNLVVMPRSFVGNGTQGIRTRPRTFAVNY